MALAVRQYRGHFVLKPKVGLRHEGLFGDEFLQNMPCCCAVADSTVPYGAVSLALGLPRTADQKHQAEKQRNGSDDRWQRQPMNFFGGDLNGTKIHSFFTRGVGDALVNKCDHSDHDEKDCEDRFSIHHSKNDSAWAEISRV